MKREFNLKRREEGTLPPERLQEILSKIYPEETVAELMPKLVGDKAITNPTEKGGEAE